MAGIRLLLLPVPHGGSGMKTGGALFFFKKKLMGGIWQILARLILESLYVDATQIGNTWDCRKSSGQSEGRDLCCIVAIRSE